MGEVVGYALISSLSRTMENLRTLGWADVDWDGVSVAEAGAGVAEA